jgi:hypothetical protein
MRVKKLKLPKKWVFTMFRKILFLSLLSASLYASGIYVKMGTTTSPKQVQEIKTLINTMGYTFHMREDEERFSLYSGPFANKNAALQALQKLKKTFPAAVAVKLRPEQVAIEQNSTPSEQNAHKSKSKKNPTEHKYPFSVALSLGFNNISASASGSINSGIINLPSESGLSYGIEAAYIYSDTLWFAAGYELLGTGDITLSNLYASANYNFHSFDQSTLYAGLLLGNSELSWDSAPLANASSTNGPSSFFYGAQVGINYPLSVANMSLFGSYALMMFDLKTSLIDPSTSNTGSIEHSMAHNLKVGLRYSF